MPFDEQLAMRVRSVVRERKDLVERYMFGGIAFKLRDHMFGGIIGQDLVVRLGTQMAFDNRHLRPMDCTGKPLKGVFYVSPAGLQTDDQLRYWFDKAVFFLINCR